MKIAADSQLNFETNGRENKQNAIDFHCLVRSGERFSCFQREHNGTSRWPRATSFAPRKKKPHNNRIEFELLFVFHFIRTKQGKQSIRPPHRCTSFSRRRYRHESNHIPETENFKSEGNSIESLVI